MKQKKIWLNKKQTKYCIAKLYDTKKDMQKAYREFDSVRGLMEGSYEKVLGVHCAYEKYKNGNGAAGPETGTVLLSLEHCGAGIISHEFMHAVLWAWKHKKYKKQFPIILKNMKEEEELLHNLTEAVRQFYLWYWKITSKTK